MKLALFDLDGVVADNRHRLDASGLPSSDPFFVRQDDVWAQGRAQVRAMQRDGWTVRYLSDRPLSLAGVSREWLNIRQFPVGDVVTRPYASHQPEAEFKLREIEWMIHYEKPDNIVLFDDSLETIVAVGDSVGVNSVYPCTWGLSEKSPQLVQYS